MKMKMKSWKKIIAMMKKLQLMKNLKLMYKVEEETNVDDNNDKKEIPPLKPSSQKKNPKGG